MNLRKEISSAINYISRFWPRYLFIELPICVVLTVVITTCLLKFFKF